MWNEGVMDEDYYYKQNVLSMLCGEEGCREKYSSVSEFKHHLNEVGLMEEKLVYGWVFGRDGQQLDLYANNIQENITALLKHISSDVWLNGLLIQFWAAVEMEGGHHCLSTLNQPFCVTQLTKGVCCYREISRGIVYGVESEADAEQLGGVGRAYRSKQLETTPDLRLYTTSEFPLRDEAARCGFRRYIALPLFDFHHQNHCFGVLELLSINSMFGFRGILLALDSGLRRAGLRSTHIPLYRGLFYEQQQQVESEITEILELGIKAIPQLYLAQVWVPCKQCHNSRCFERASFIDSCYRILNEDYNIDAEMSMYVEACNFHNQQIDVSRLGQHLCAVSISKNPLAHYAERARLPQVFTICLQSVNNNKSNHFYVMEFFLQPNCRDGDSPLHLLFKILKTKLKSFKCTVLAGNFLEEFVVQSRQPLNPNAFELESIDMLKEMDSCMEKVSVSNFIKFLETDEICLFRLYDGDNNDDEDSYDDSMLGWVFRAPIEEKSDENNINNHSLCVPKIPSKEKIQRFMIKIASLGDDCLGEYYMMQFWAPAMIENRRCLKTLDQPYALSFLTKEAASFRNKCIKHHYFVDEEAKEDELGPVGRVFRNGYHELLSDIHFYSTKGFPMRNYAIHCGIGTYFALPVFDEHQQFNKHNCVGVLEFIGFQQDDLDDVDKDLKYIERTLEGENLCSDIHSYLKANVRNKEVENEINNALSLISVTPQCYRANAWVQNGKCMRNNSKCMECLSGKRYVSCRPSDFTHAEPKIGMIDLVLESESKSCFCQNVYQLGQSPSFYERKLRCSACFAICLQSSHTGDLLYVLDFFLYRVPATLEYLMSFLHFLLPVLKHELKSFKLATGKQLGEEELVVEVIEFSETNHLISSYSEHLVIGGCPVKFKSVLYSQKEHQHIEEQQVQPNPEVEQSKQREGVVSNFKKTGKGKRKMGLHLSLEVLKPHFGKKLEDVAVELGVGRSTIKRACRDYDINRWPGNKKQARNPSLFERGSIQGHIMPSSSSNLDTSLQQHAITERIQDETEKVMIKVKYEGDVIKFVSCLPLRVEKLWKEVGTKLKLKMGSFKLKYMDEDDDEILIADDDDLQLCAKTQISAGKTCIQLFVPK